MKARGLSAETADHLMVEAVRKNALPASNLPKVIQAWEKPRHEEFTPRTAWSLFNAFTEIQKSRSPRAQFQDSLKISQLFRDSI